MDDIKISIVTPSYNQGDYIEETIQSILNQTYKNIEYIIQDGCSSDKTIEVLNKYKNEDNIKVYIEKDKGQSEAINKGFRKSTGELIGWINSDDILERDCIEKIVKKYKQDKNVSILYGDIELIDSRGGHIGNVNLNDITYNKLLNVNPNITQQGSFYKTELVKKIGYLDENLHYTMDYDLWLRLLKENDKAVKVKGVIAKFRLHNESKTSGGKTFFKFWKDIFYVRKYKHESHKINIIHLNLVKSVMLAAIKKASRGLSNE